MRTAATKWKAWADVDGAGSERAKALVPIYMAALDSGKSGELQKVPPALLKVTYAYHLQKRATLADGGAVARGGGGGGGQPSSPQRQSALLRMWTAVASNRITGVAVPPTCPPVRIQEDEDFYVRRYDARGQPSPYCDETTWQQLQAKCKMQWDLYVQRIICSQGKLPNGEWVRLMQRLRLDFLAGPNGPRDPTDPCNELRAKASAWRHFVYSSRQTKPCGRCARCVAAGERERKLTPVWAVCGDILLDLKVRNNMRRNHPSCAPPAVDPDRLINRLRSRRRAEAEAAAEREHLQLGEDDSNAGEPRGWDKV